MIELHGALYGYLLQVRTTYSTLPKAVFLGRYGNFIHKDLFKIKERNNSGAIYTLK